MNLKNFPIIQVFYFSIPGSEFIINTERAIAGCVLYARVKIWEITVNWIFIMIK